jgi:hypothetical protein
VHECMSQVSPLRCAFFFFLSDSHSCFSCTLFFFTFRYYQCTICISYFVLFFCWEMRKKEPLKYHFDIHISNKKHAPQIIEKKSFFIF